MAGLDLEQRVASVVAAQLDSANGRLEQMVDRALQVELNRRVAAIFEARASDAESVVRVPARTTETKTCNRCGEVKSITEYERHRRTCRACRREQERQRGPRERRQAKVEPEEGHSLAPTT